MKQILLLCSTALLGLAPLLAAPVDSVGDGAERQEKIQQQTGLLVAQLDSMIQEYERNGLQGDDVQMVRRLRGTLAALSEQEMQKVIDLFSRGAPGGGGVTAASAAYAQQKEIIVGMQRILAAHERAKEALALALSIGKLAERQAANLLTAVDVRDWTGLKTGKDATNVAIEASRAAQTSEQQALGEELGIILGKIAAYSRDAANQEMAAKFHASVGAAEKIPAMMTAAAGALEASQWNEAVAAETAARDELRKLARQLTPPRDRKTALTAAAQQIARIIEDQAGIVAGAAEAEAKLAAPKKSKKAPESLAGLERRQADVAPRAEDVAQDVAEFAPAMAATLGESVKEMNEAKEALREKKTAVAGEAGRAAIEKLEEARKQVETLLAAEKSEGSRRRILRGI